MDLEIIYKHNLIGEKVKNAYQKILMNCTVNINIEY